MNGGIGLTWRAPPRGGAAGRGVSVQVRCRECEAAFATGLLAEAGGRRVVARVVVSCPACRACAAYGPDDFLLT